MVQCQHFQFLMLPFGKINCPHLYYMYVMHMFPHLFGICMGSSQIIFTLLQLNRAMSPTIWKTFPISSNILPATNTCPQLHTAGREQERGKTWEFIAREFKAVIQSFFLCHCYLPSICYLSAKRTLWTTYSRIMHIKPV